MSGLNGSSGDTTLSQASVREALAQFRAANSVTVTIPTEGGYKFPLKLRKVGLEALVLSGSIPDQLSGVVNGILKGKAVELDAAGLSMMGKVFDMLLQACVTWPPLAETGTEEALGLDEIPFSVKEAIFAWANGEANALAPFRPQPGRNGEAVPSVQNISPTAE